MFWSLSFAVSAATWEHIGGCCELYRGYGGEATDFAQCAAAGGVTMHWVGGTDAFHQYHPVSNPPIEHLDDILCNAAVFHRRWGWWPMEGWLHEFENRGLIRATPPEGHIAWAPPLDIEGEQTAVMGTATGLLSRTSTASGGPQCQCRQATFGRLLLTVSVHVVSCRSAGRAAPCRCARNGYPMPAYLHGHNH